VLVCGAVGCPVLEDKPFAGSDMNIRMDAATRRYLSGPTGALVSEGGLQLSKIFDWYAADFKSAGGPLAFVRRHLPSAVDAKLGADPKVSYLEYNWTLNQQ
jgi:hypothetical protein